MQLIEDCLSCRINLENKLLTCFLECFLRCLGRISSSYQLRIVFDLLKICLEFLLLGFGEVGPSATTFMMMPLVAGVIG